jgi:hypothetical protein
MDALEEHSDDVDEYGDDSDTDDDGKAAPAHELPHPPSPIPHPTAPQSKLPTLPTPRMLTGPYVPRSPGRAWSRVPGRGGKCAVQGSVAFVLHYAAHAAHAAHITPPDHIICRDTPSSHSSPRALLTRSAYPLLSLAPLPFLLLTRSARLSSFHLSPQRRG